MKNNQLGSSLIELLLVLLIGSVVISGAILLYNRSRHNVATTLALLSQTRQSRLALSLINAELKRLHKQNIQHCPVPLSLAPLLTVQQADSAEARRLGLNAVPHTVLLSLQLPITQSGDAVIYAAAAAEVGQKSITLAGVQASQVMLATRHWLLFDCNQRQLLTADLLGNDLKLAEPLKANIHAGTIAWPLIAVRYYIGILKSTRQAGLFVMDSSGRHELLSGIHDLQASYGVIQGHHLVWQQASGVGSPHTVLLKLQIGSETSVMPLF